MPVNEALELEHRLPAAVGLGLDAIIVNGVWPVRFSGDEAHRLRVNIARLRQKVEPEPSAPKYVLTRPGIGYTLARQEQDGNS